MKNFLLLYLCHIYFLSFLFFRLIEYKLTMAEVIGLTDEEANACCVEPDPSTKVSLLSIVKKHFISIYNFF